MSLTPSYTADWPTYVFSFDPQSMHLLPGCSAFSTLPEADVAAAHACMLAMDVCLSVRWCSNDSDVTMFC